jgi:hypothetical protein
MKKPNRPETHKGSTKPRPKSGRKPSTTVRSKAPGGRGAARLRDSVNDLAGNESDCITRARTDKACDSQMTGARLINELPGAQRSPPETKTKKKRGPQPWVKRLCSEPEWEGPWEDEDTHRDSSKLLPSEPDFPAD